MCVRTSSPVAGLLHEVGVSSRDRVDRSSMSEARRAKPLHLAPDYAAQFGDEEVAAAYRHRPPYPAETFAILDRLLGAAPRCVLELGAGTGELTIRLAPLVAALIPAEPSRPIPKRPLERSGLA